MTAPCPTQIAGKFSANITIYCRETKNTDHFADVSKMVCSDFIRHTPLHDLFVEALHKLAL